LKDNIPGAWTRFSRLPLTGENLEFSCCPEIYYAT